MTRRPPPAKRRVWSLRSRALRAALYQVLVVVLLGLVIWFLAHNTVENMRVRGIQSGFDFLAQPAGFDIGETLMSYQALDPYWKAFAVGVLNTLRVAVIGIVLTTLIGSAIGIGRFSRNAIVRALCYGYVELFRNVPILLQLLMWYLLLTEWLPNPGEPISLFGLFFLSKGGLSFPAPVWAAGHALAAIGLLAGITIACLYVRWARRQFEMTGRVRATLMPSIAIVVGCVIVGWFAGGSANVWRVPEVGDVAVTGGGEVTPEFISVLLGLVFYTAAFVAEVVRAGVQSVPKGQVEAANAIGLARTHQMRLVIIPQALRVIIPPMTNQYLNLTKNSSLAVAIGYPDVVSISNTAINQTGRAVECIVIIMLVYLATSLSTSAFMNWYNARAAIKER
jgi:general L-amino acid transport system permease protein